MKNRTCLLSLFAFLASSPIAHAAASPAQQVAAIRKDCVAAASAIQQRQAERTLYERMGKRPGVRRLVIELVDLHTVNRRLNHHVRGTQKGNLVDHATDFLASRMGGSEK